MILSDDEITKAIGRGDIVIDPFDIDSLGPNSYDVHLSEHLACHKPRREQFKYGCLTLPIDAAVLNPIERFHIPSCGFDLQPGRLYLASTVEYTETRGLIPYLDGKSSVGRLGIQVHLTAGRGDAGFKGHWTLEMSVVERVRVYAGMPIAQLTYHVIFGTVLRPYDKKPTAKYNNRNPEPMPSQMWKNFAPKCETCGKQVRDGLRFCQGLSECWKKGNGV
jgi:dCTP deaminase